MADGPKRVATGWPVGGAGKVDALATRALSVVASRGGRGRVDGDLVARLEVAIRSTDREARHVLVDEMRATGIPWEEIVDHYIPATARRLGEEWCADNIGFAEVTIGSSRLQAMLRDACLSWSENRVPHPQAPNILLFLREDEHHTLGAMVAACQLRRLGASVRLALGVSEGAAADLVATKDFDAIMIAASSGEKLESVRRMVKILRTASRAVTPIVLGGTILETDRDARALTGADHATSEPEEALRLCGLKMPCLDAGLCEIGI